MKELGLGCGREALLLCLDSAHVDRLVRTLGHDCLYNNSDTGEEPRPRLPDDDDDQEQEEEETEMSIMREHARPAALLVLPRTSDQASDGWIGRLMWS